MELRENCSLLSVSLIPAADPLPLSVWATHPFIRVAQARISVEERWL